MWRAKKEGSIVLILLSIKKKLFDIFKLSLSPKRS